MTRRTLVPQLVAAGLVQLPGLLVLGGAVLAVVGLAPRWAASISWSLLFVALLLGPLFGPSFKLPQALQDLSPFAHVPKAPAADITAGPAARPDRRLPGARSRRLGGDPAA